LGSARKASIGVVLVGEVEEFGWLAGAMGSGEYAAASRAMTYRLTGAFCRAWKDGRAVVGTQYVLEELAACMPSLRRGLAVLSLQHEAPVRRRLRALVQGLGVEEAELGEDLGLDVVTGIDFEVAAVLREAQWRARRRLTAFHEDRAPVPAWSEEVHTAVRKALTDAAYAGVPRAHGMHLLVSMLNGPHSGAAEIMATLGVDRSKLLRALPVSASIRSGNVPMAPAADGLMACGVLATPRSSLLRGLGRLLGAAMNARAHTSLFVAVVMQESVRQAVRVGSTQVGQAHLVVALCAVDTQLRDTGRMVADRWAEYNCGGQTLARWGVGYVSSAEHCAGLPVSQVPVCRARRWRVARSDPRHGTDIARAVEDAEQCATRLGHRYVGTSHLLMALLSDPDGAGCFLLREMGVRDTALRRDVAGQLGLLA
jgi:hypothetical protein